MHVQDEARPGRVVCSEMKIPVHPQPQGQQLRRIASSLRNGRSRDLPLLDSLLRDQGAAQCLSDMELRELILVVKHHRPDLALILLTHLRTPKERLSLGSCVAALWSRVDINAAWRAVATSSLPERERLELHSAMM